MRPRKYHVTLTQDEYNELLQLVRKGTTQAYKITHGYGPSEYPCGIIPL